MSCNKAFFPSPNPGHFTMATLRKPFNLFTTRVSNTCFEISSAKINSGTANWVAFSNNGTISLTVAIF
uniref:Chaperonin 60 subunit alpha 2ic isoform X2 n=1 Tax=Rhizophora mucronata TaxID=61149 RepID=A0A2P2JDY8_RHIMU